MYPQTSVLDMEENQQNDSSSWNCCLVQYLGFFAKFHRPMLMVPRSQYTYGGISFHNSVWDQLLSLMDLHLVWISPPWEYPQDDHVHVSGICNKDTDGRSRSKLESGKSVFKVDGLPLVLRDGAILSTGVEEGVLKKVNRLNSARPVFRRNFDLEVMEFENIQNNALAKLPMLKLGEAPRSKDNRNWNQGSSSKAVKIEDASEKAMCAIDGAGFDWSDMADEEIQDQTWLLHAFLDLKARFNTGRQNVILVRARDLMLLSTQIVGFGDLIMRQMVHHWYFGIATSVQSGRIFAFLPIYLSMGGGAQETSREDGSLEDNGTADQQVNTARPEVNFGSRDVSTVVPEVNTASLEDLSTVQTRRMTSSYSELGFLSAIYEGKTHKDLHTCLFCLFLSQEEPKRVSKALSDPTWVEAMQEELLQFKLAFLYGQIEEEVYVCQPPGFEDPDHPDKVYKVVKALYGLHQAPVLSMDTFWTIILVQMVFKREDCPNIVIKQDNRVQQKKERHFISQDKSSMRILESSNSTDVRVASTLKDLEKAFVTLLETTQDRKSIPLEVLNMWLLQIAVDREVKITATINGHSMTITEGSLRRHLKLDDQDGISSIPNSEIFEQLALMGYHTDSDKLTFQKGAFSPQWRFLIHSILHCLSPKKTAWEQFSSNIATALICLATNRKYNFSRMIFEHMVSNISSPHKFLMYPRFIQLCLDMQRNQLQQHTRSYHVPSLSMKVFNNMKRPTKGFSGQEVALFPTMLDVTEPSPSPSRITSSPSLSPKHSPSPTHSPSPIHSPLPASLPTPEHITAAPTQPSPTQPSPTQPSLTHQSPRAEHHFPTPHDSPFHAVHLHGSDEGSLKLNELMNLVTKLSDLKKTKKTYSSTYTKLILRVKKLESQI
ncbi:putative ribonuclease H-like domain-containing protein, partial [Tanacetum coccineum]